MSGVDTQRIPEYLLHILDAISRIHLYVAGMTEAAFLADDKTRDAVIRNYEILGEAARNVERHHPDFVSQHAHVPWSLMVAMRNRVAHGYFEVDYEMVWRSIHQDLPPLREAVKGIFEMLSPEL